jgi:hypothetical protein
MHIGHAISGTWPSESVIGQTSLACAQSSAASTTAQQYLVDTIASITPCLLLYLVGRAGKTKEVAKAQCIQLGVYSRENRSWLYMHAYKWSNS